MNSPKQPNSFPLRMPDELRARIEQRAASNSRSANAEIVVMLTAMLDAESDLAAIPTHVLVPAALKRLGSTVQIVVTPDVATAAGIKQSAPAKKHKA
ncbi:Arc family DNA-binding protein [Massilia sp. PWRC2]|uniref:Arc family DNA-binding protein n=1 Tax=Massilia sp. PWRC2 TaxID=2804626 RepID=UPI003CE86BF5